MKSGGMCKAVDVTRRPGVVRFSMTLLQRLESVSVDAS